MTLQTIRRRMSGLGAVLTCTILMQCHCLRVPWLAKSILSFSTEAKALVLEVEYTSIYLLQAATEIKVNVP